MAEDTPFLTASKTKASMAAMRQPLHGPFVWAGDELADASDWRFDLTPAMAEEIDAALTRFKARGGAWPDMRRVDFRIPLTARLLGEIATALVEGRGLAKVSGLPVARYAEEDLKTIWYGIGLHLGTPVSQSHAGLRLKVIRDEGASVGEVYGELRERTAPGFFSPMPAPSPTGRCASTPTGRMWWVCSALTRRPRALEQDRQHRGHPQRNPATAPRPAGTALSSLSAQPSGRGKR